MQVGDLVVQKGWETDGVGIVARILKASSLNRLRATVQWADGDEAHMYQSQLRVMSESR